jgi:FAD/FMN-containing dehydrogenase
MRRFRAAQTGGGVMVLAASSPAEVVQGISTATAKITSFDLGGMNRVLQHTPEDMTVTVEAGSTLANLQSRLAEHGQWLPVDPPRAERLTIGALLGANKSGPRRCGFGTVREYLLGIKVVLADGRVIKAGGKVVKNVAGYDLCKLFVGSHGTLGVIVEATFKVLPKPETEEFLKLAPPNLEDLNGLLERINESQLTPVVLDAYGERGTSTLAMGFAGAREDVDWQVRHARELGFHESASLEYERAFWDSSEPVNRISVLASKLAQTLQELSPISYVARAANGIIYGRGGKGTEGSTVPRELIRRVKDTYDPKHLLPELPW